MFLRYKGTEFETPADFFNPIKNVHWRADTSRHHGQYTVAEFWDCIKSLYSYDNLNKKEHIGIFFRSWFSSVTTDSPQLDRLSVLLAVDPELLPYYFFVRIKEQTTYGWRFDWFKVGATTSVNSNGYWRFDLASAGQSVGTTSRSDAGAIEGLNTFLKEVKAHWDPLIAANANNLWYKNTYCGPYSTFLSTFCYFIDNSIYICEIGSSDSPLTAKELFDKLQVSPTLQIVCTLKSYGEFDPFGYKELVSKLNKTPLYKIFNYSTNVLKHLPYPLTEKGEHNPTLYGVELECKTDYPIEEIINASDEPFFLAKSDSTITGTKTYAMELVTVPASLKALKRQYARWFSKLDYSKFDITTVTNNGMHVHIGREFFEGNSHIRNMCWFLTNPCHRDFIVAISERGSYDAMQSYTTIANFNGSWKKSKAFLRCKDVQSGHRGIMNFNKAPTIEIRMFKGIVSFASVLKNLEFVDSLLEFSRGMNSHRELALTHYYNWLLHTPPNKYSVLKKYIDQYCKMNLWLPQSEIKEIIFQETDSEKIVGLIKKSGFKITNKHVSILNKNNRRTFTLDKDTGELHAIPQNVSKLRPLDRILEQRYIA